MPFPFSPGEVLTSVNLNEAIGYVCQATRTTNLSCGNGATVVMTLPSEDFDPLGWHDGGGANPERITPTIAGWYEVIGGIAFDSGFADYSRQLISIRKNGAETTPPRRHDLRVGGATGGPFSTSAGVITMNGTTDYIDAFVIQTNAATAARNLATGFLYVKLVYVT